MSDLEKENLQFASDLDWMAFCYVADELSGLQLAEFESRLETDQEAREAVAQAMALATDIYRSDQPAVRSVANRNSGVASDTHRKILGWSSAAVLLVGISLFAWYLIDSSGNEVADDAVGSAQKLAEVWVNGLEDDVAITLVDFSPDSIDEFEFQSDSDSEGDDWMLIALNELESAETEN